MSYVLFSAWSVASPFQFDYHVLRPIQYMHSGQTLPARPSCPMSYSVDGGWPASLFLLDHRVLCPIQWMESGQPVSSCSTIMSYVLFSTWSLASQTLQLDHHVLCPVQCMESGQSVPFLLDHHVLCTMSCPLQGVKAVGDQGNAAD